MGLLQKIVEHAERVDKEAKAERAAKAKEEYKPFQKRRPEYSFNEDEKLENTAPHLVASIYEARNNTRDLKDNVCNISEMMEQLSNRYDELEKHYVKLETMLQELNEKEARLEKANQVM